MKDEQKKHPGYPLFEKLDSDRDLIDDEAGTTGEDNATRQSSSRGEKHAKENQQGPIEKLVDKLTGEDHSKWS